MDAEELPHVGGLTPRADEWRPVAALLDSGAYDTPESLAKAVLKVAYLSLLQRDWYLTLVQAGPGLFGYGLSATEHAAEAVELGGGLPRAIVRISSAAGHLERVERGDFGTPPPARMARRGT